MIRNAGNSDLSIDAVTAVYKNMTGSGRDTSKPRRTQPQAKQQVIKRSSEKNASKSPEKIHRKDEKAGKKSSEKKQ